MWTWGQVRLNTLMLICFYHFHMRKMVVNHFLFEKLITVQNKLHCVFTNEYKWTFERGRIALRVLSKRYHFEWGRFHVLVEWIPFKCQNMHSNLDFVSFSYFLWPDFVVALWLALFTPAWWCQVTDRYLVEERLFSIVQDLSFLSALRGWGGSTTPLWDWPEHSSWTKRCSAALTSSFYPICTFDVSFRH